MTSPRSATVYVWDPLVRVGHWLLVAGFFTAFLVDDDAMDVHVWAGYLVGAIVAVRIVWGIVGTRHARFADFVYAPWTVARYAADLLRFRSPRYIGHSPAGGAMVVGLLIVLAVTVATGLVAYAESYGLGPLAGTIPRGDDDWEDVHEILSNLAFAMVLAHVAGVALASFAHRENLVAAMIRGRKRAED